MQLITLTSDFGIQNHVVASIKGKILAEINDAHIIDIAHHVATFNLQQASYIFGSSYQHFPKNSFHFVFNNLHENPNQQLLYVYENQQHIFCADNGFLTLLFHQKPIQVFALTDKPRFFNYLTVTELFIQQMAILLHGQKLGLENVSVENMMIKKPKLAFYQNNILDAQVLHIDPYGNVILNVTQQQFEEAKQGRTFKILFMRDEEITNISRQYSDVPLSEKLCLFNADGYLEIAVNQGNAASLFGFNESTQRSLFYNTIKIFFE